MAVQEIWELYNRSAEENKDGHRTYTRVFSVLTDNFDDDGLVCTAAINNTFGVNRQTYYLSGTASDPQAFLVDVKARCVEEDGLTWECTYVWSTDLSLSSHPALEPPVYTWDFAVFERPVDYDIFGSPILNTAGVPSSDPVMRDDIRPILGVSRKQLFFSAYIALVYSNCINSDNFFGCPPGTVKLSPPKVQQITDPTWGVYYQSSFEFHLNPQGWSKKLLSQGVLERGGDGQLRPITCKGVPVTEPVLLDWYGRAMRNGGTPVFKEYHVYPRAPLSHLIAQGV